MKGVKNTLTRNDKIAIVPRFFVVICSVMLKHVRSKIRWLFLGGVCALLSCNSIEKPVSTGSVRNASAEITYDKDTVTIEIFTIPIAPHQHKLLQQLWQEVDEQSLPPQLRRELLAQGFRVGILGNLLSPALAQFLKISSNAKTKTEWGGVQEFSAADAANAPAVSRNLQTLLPGMRSLVKIFDDSVALPELALFWNENGQICGQTFKDVTGLLCVSATANKDGSAQIQIIPELEHGFLEQRIRSVSGMFVQERGRPRRTFEALTLSQHLLPGQWLILGTTDPDSIGAGKAFFTRKSAVLEQRLVAIRLVNTTSPPTILPTLPPAAHGETDQAMPERN